MSTSVTRSGAGVAAGDRINPASPDEPAANKLDGLNEPQGHWSEEPDDAHLPDEPPGHEEEDVDPEDVEDDDRSRSSWKSSNSVKCCGSWGIDNNMEEDNDAVDAAEPSFVGAAPLSLWRAAPHQHGPVEGVAGRHAAVDPVTHTAATPVAICPESVDKGPTGQILHHVIGWLII